jgi:hypothetical protein
MVRVLHHTRVRSWRLLLLLAAGALGWGLLPWEIPRAAETAVASPQVEIKKLSTGKEATVRHGEREWFIYIDVDDNRTMIIRTESHKGKEIENTPEIIDRPMSSAEVDRIINDFISGVKSTIKP